MSDSKGIPPHVYVRFLRGNGLPKNAFCIKRGGSPWCIRYILYICIFTPTQAKWQIGTAYRRRSVVDDLRCAGSKSNRAGSQRLLKNGYFQNTSTRTGFNSFRLISNAGIPLYCVHFAEALFSQASSGRASGGFFAAGIRKVSLHTG